MWYCEGTKGQRFEAKHFLDLVNAVVDYYSDEDRDPIQVTQVGTVDDYEGDVPTEAGIFNTFCNEVADRLDSFKQEGIWERQAIRQFGRNW